MLSISLKQNKNSYVSHLSINKIKALLFFTRCKVYKQTGCTDYLSKICKKKTLKSERITSTLLALLATSRNKSSSDMFGLEQYRLSISYGFPFHHCDRQEMVKKICSVASTTRALLNEHLSNRILLECCVL